MTGDLAHPREGITHALQFTAAGSASQEQEVGPRQLPYANINLTDCLSMLQIHNFDGASLCGGEYVISAWLRYSADYDGMQQALHSRFKLGDASVAALFAEGPASGTEMSYTPHRVQELALTSVRIGGWPTEPDRWEQVSVGVRVPTDFE